jgi:hypothetical protein
MVAALPDTAYCLHTFQLPLKLVGLDLSSSWRMHRHFERRHQAVPHVKPSEGAGYG